MILQISKWALGIALAFLALLNIASENHRPYGDKLNNQTGGQTNPIGYANKPFDNQTGLSFMGARYYHPTLGRFLSPDPVHVQLDNVHSHNRYAYANNNPYKYIDQDGKYAELVVEVASLTVGYMSLRENIRAGNTRGAIVDGMGMLADIAGAAIPGLPGAVGLGIKASREAAQAAKSLPDSALVCRGGTCTADKFTSGSGTSLDAAGKLQGVLVNSGTAKSVEQLTVGIPNKQVGVTTVGDVRRAGGNVIPSPTANNANHCTLCGITPKQAEQLMTPTVRNPNAR